MRGAAASICRRFGASTRGIAAVEFALILPMLMVLFLSTFDAANGIAVYMKVRSASYVLAAITNQFGTGGTYPAIATTDMTNITGAASKVLAPYTGTPFVVLSQIKATSNTAAVVSWSYSLNSTALTPSNTYSGLPANFAKNSCGNKYPCYAIVATVSYTFTPMFGSFMTGPITLADTVFATPRVTACVQYNGVPSSC
ncbi:MAG TPA: TadE/TadG family type IV pilus assembly protein [Xanthobacteraceae bacterium]